MRHLRKEVVVIEKSLVETMVEKAKTLQTMQNNEMLFNEVLLFIHVMTDAIPFLSKDNKETIILLRNDWNQRYCNLEKENLPNNINKINSTRLEIREEALLLSKPLEKSNFFDNHLPQLRERLQELSINLHNIAKYKGSYREKKKGEQFKSALGQIYAAIFDLKKWFNCPSDFSVEQTLEKINHQLEIATQENKSDLNIEILKEDIQACFKSIQLVKGILNKLVDRLVELKKKKDAINLKDIESLSPRLLIKIKAIVKNYHAQKGEFLFLYDLIKLIFVNDWEKYAYSENFTLPFLLEDLGAFESIYLALNQNRHFLPRVKTAAETEKNVPDASEIQELNINESSKVERSTHCQEAEKSADVELNKGTEDSTFEDWKYKVEGNLRSLEKAITNASDELLVRVSSLFYNILQCFVREIELKRSELINENDQPMRQESIVKAMRSRRARDRRALTGEAGNASRRKVICGRHGHELRRSECVPDAGRIAA
ncbi:hypothetical protein [Rickettsiella endosymbiont of Dermanyssus gallinae]|uniref:hypothetical protein n=1 Tax=Rickettsiella endosymbiont of Dermanyssus gallinae TaxID=2856608 RepID=UPI001C5306D8|nr:hypothetical protein [Rickettsiella endosymbiont of Dermanyssus gallinae]